MLLTRFVVFNETLSGLLLFFEGVSREDREACRVISVHATGCIERWSYREPIELLIHTVMRCSNCLEQEVHTLESSHVHRVVVLRAEHGEQSRRSINVEAQPIELIGFFVARLLSWRVARFRGCNEQTGKHESFAYEISVLINQTHDVGYRSDPCKGFQPRDRRESIRVVHRCVSFNELVGNVCSANLFVWICLIATVGVDENMRERFTLFHMVVGHEGEETNVVSIGECIPAVGSSIARDDGCGVRELPHNSFDD